MRARLIGLGALLALAACRGEGGREANAQANVAVAPVQLDQTQQQVQALPEGQRNGVLFRAIRDARHPCQQVEGSEVVATSNGLPTYFATCEDGAVYAVAVAGEGTLRVRPVTPAEGR